jgi:hypothetical protein
MLCGVRLSFSLFSACLGLYLFILFYFILFYFILFILFIYSVFIYLFYFIYLFLFYLSYLFYFILFIYLIFLSIFYFIYLYRSLFLDLFFSHTAWGSDISSHNPCCSSYSRILFIFLIYLLNYLSILILSILFPNIFILYFINFLSLIFPINTQIVILALSGLFYDLPKAILAAVVIMSVRSKFIFFITFIIFFLSDD